MSTNRNEETGVFQKIQSNTGCLLFIIGLGMLGFILMDAFSNNSAIFNNNSANSVGEVDGEPIEYAEFNDRYENYLQTLSANNPGVEVNDAIRDAYKNQAWKDLIEEKTTHQEFSSLGIDVRDEEMLDVTIGENTNETLKKTFIDPETKQFSRALLTKFLTEDIVDDEEKAKQWKQFEDGLAGELKIRKYRELIGKATYTSKLDVKVISTNGAMKANVSIVGLDYSTISDSAITLTTSDYQDYINANKAELEQEASKDVEYVVFNIVPSSDDTLEAQKWVSEQREDFEATIDDSLFVALRNSESPYDPSFLPRGQFSPVAETALFNADTGEVVGPFYDKGRFVMYKVGAIGKDSLASIRCSHILVSAEGRTSADTAAAVRKGREIIKNIKSGATTFEAESADNFDGTGDVAGDLGWIRGEESYRMPKEFNKALFRHGNGDLFVVTTPRGIHVVKITEGPTKKTLQTTAIERNIFAGSKTTKAFYKEAGQFLAKATEAEDFEKLAEDNKLTRRFAEKIVEEGGSVPGVKESKEFLRWMFKETTEIGEVSDIIEAGDKLIVARLMKERAKGTPSVDDVKDEIADKVMQMKKSEILSEKLETAMKSAKDADELATAVGTYANNAPSLSFQESNVPYVGNSPKLVGAIFGSETNSFTSPINGDRGVYVAYVKDIVIEKDEEIDPQGIADRQRDLEEDKKVQSYDKVNAAILKKNNVKDLRYKFY
jgi:peptidyl-prolyl cis-trans isomerase D